jgi:hypothetical protein
VRASRFLAAATLTLLALAARDAGAWTCGAETNITVWPPPTVAAPLNVQPLVSIFDTTGMCIAPVCTTDAEHILLVRAPSRGRPSKPIQVELVRSWDFDTRLLRIIPAAPLEPNRRYEVRSRDPETAAPGSIGKLIGTFRTGTYVDKEAPRWTGPPRAVTHPLLPPPKRARERVVSLEPGPAQTQPYFEVFGPVAVDDHAATDDLGYLVWRASMNAELDYDEDPIGFFPHEPSRAASDRLFVVGPENECFSRGSPFWPNEPFKIGVRVVDLAGNASPPRETVVDFGPRKNPAK